MNPNESSRAINVAFDATKRRVMCVDDNHYFLTASSRFLATCGHVVTQVTNGKDAIALVRENNDRYDVILVEDSISDLGGTEVVRALRDCGFQRRILIKASDLSPARRVAYESLGVYAMIETPVDLYKLLRCIQNPVEEAPPQ